MLVIIPCGSKKRNVRSKAKDLYIGTYFKACLDFAQSLYPDTNIRILSGKYGIVPLDKEIDPYEMRLGEKGSITLPEIMQQVREQNLLTASPVVIVAGSQYAQMAKKIWPHATSVLENAGGMGKQIQRLKQLTKKAVSNV